jgi:regulatory protein
MDEKRPKTRKRAPRKIDAGYLENAALYYLQCYASSSKNLKNVLSRKIMRGCAHHGQNPEDFLPLLDPLVARYEKAGLLDDAVYADGRVGALRRQGLSRQAIMQRLQRKGLSSADIVRALDRIDTTAAEHSGDPDRELAAARRMAQRKRLGPWRQKPLADPKAAQKELAALARAGFSYDIARRALETPDDVAVDVHPDF